MFKWLDKLLSRPYEKAADEVGRVVKETQTPPFRNPTHPSKKKPLVGKDAQNLVLWFEKNRFHYLYIEDWAECVNFRADGINFYVEKPYQRAKHFCHDHMFGGTVLNYTDDETSWILYNAKRIQDGREKQREKELKGQFK